MKIGLAQMDIVWEDKRENYDKCEEIVKTASKHRVELVVFPEMTLTGFSMAVEKIGEADDESLKLLSSLAVKYNISLVFGYVKRTGEKGENIQAYIDCKGKILYQYSKIHPFSYGGEDKFYLCGNQIEQVDINGFCVTPLICYDLRFPEIFQIVSDKTNLFIIIANWPKTRSAHWISLLKARGIENQSYIVAVNRIGDGNGIEYSGDSMIVSPNGDIVNCVYAREDLLIADIDPDLPDLVRNEFAVKNDRRNDFYLKNYPKKG